MWPPTSAKALPERTSFSLRRHFDEAIVVVREHGGRWLRAQNGPAHTVTT